MRASSLTKSASALIALIAFPFAPASAHPHVWVTVKETVLYKDGAITGLRQSWTFDEYYTEMAIEGLDKNGDGKYDRQELQELAQVNVDGLKEFDYFTYAKAGDMDVKFKPPVDYWLEYKDKILTLHMTSPLQQPVRADDKGFKFSIFDSSYFIAFDLEKEHPVALGDGAPSGCKAVVHQPSEDDDTQALNQAFSGVMGAGGTIDLGSSQNISVECPKS